MQQNSSLAEVQAVLTEAMDRRLMITAIYNGATLTLAPHQIVLRNDAFYLGAVNPKKSRLADEEPSLGYFKVDGLSDVMVRDENFQALPPEACAPAREGDRVIAALDCY